MTMHSFLRLSASTAIIIALASPAPAATVGSDGGVTLWISYDDSNSAGLDIDDTITVMNNTAGASCDPTNNARGAAGAPASPSQCPGGASSCTGREKVTGDMERFAEYVWQSTDGATYIRRAYVADEGRSWDTADIQWNMNTAGSTGAVSGWKVVGAPIRLRSSMRPCIHDVLHHEFGHYFHRLPDRYGRIADGYYLGTIDGGSVFDMAVTVGDPNSVMSGNFPHLFNDTTNASITVDYTEPGQPATSGEVLTPGLLTDVDPDNDGPDRAHHGFTEPFAQDDWATMPGEHAHLSGVHTEGDFTPPDLSSMPAVDIVFIGDEAPPPGTVLLLDRSGSMGVQTDGIPASQYVQEAGLYLYHSALPTDFVGTYLYNATVEELFNYEEYDATNQLPQANFRTAQGLTDIAEALKTGIDELIATHGEAGVNGAQIVLMSDGKQTTGANLWDEVDRANQHGIQINTFSFGDADATTMAQIATATSGGNTEVSERGDAFELKLGMAHEFSDIRGFTPVHSFKDVLRKTEVIDRVETFEGRFVVPPFSRDLAFYSFLDGGNAALYDLELIDPAGNVLGGQADSIAERGRFNGVKATRPTPGEWTYRVLGTRKSDFVLPSDRPFELTAYVRNPALDASLALDGQTDRPGVVRVTGQVTFRYPLTGVEARAHIFRGGDRLGAIQLFDDGDRGGDRHHSDGIYTGLLDVREFGLDRPEDDRRAGKTRLDGQFLIGDDAGPAPNAHYETGTTVEMLNADYAANGRSELPFEAWTTRTLDFTRGIKDEGGLRLIDPGFQRRVRPGDEGKLVLQLRGMRPIREQLRVALGHGVKARVEDFEPAREHLGGTLVLSYAVDERAAEGPRELRLQQGAAQLSLAKALFVAR
jgi:hypothetical protein